MAASDHPPSLPSSSALPTIRISISAGSRLPRSPSPESPRTPDVSRTQATREGSLARSGSNASTRSAVSNNHQGVRTPTRMTRTRNPPPSISSHAGGILPPASFFRIGQTPPRPQGNGPLATMPYGPAKLATASPSSAQKQVQNRTPAVIPPGSPTIPSAPAVLASSSREGTGAVIPMTSISSRTRPGNSGITDEGGINAGDTSFTYSTPHASYRTKASRDPLLSPVNSAPGSLRSTTEQSAHAGIASVFARRSIESSRMSSDLEQGAREAGSEQNPNFPSLSTGPTATDFTRPSSLDNSDDRAHTYRTIGDPSSGDLHHSKLSQIDRAGPKATIHPHPVIIPASPILNPKTGQPVRNYQLIPSKNIFFLRGKALTGGDTPLPFIATLTLIVGLAAAWFACTAPWWWHNVSVAVPIVAGYMTLFCLASLLMTAFRDPGILPRDLDIDPPMASIDGDSPPAPLPRDLRVRGGVVRTKYCPTCQLYRPPRASHCRLCDNCVDNCDHHCQWVNNCVGRRNYTHFFTFLIAVSITDIFIIITTALHIYLTSHRDHLSFRHTLSRTVGSVVCFLISFLTIWPVLTLLGYHCRLIVLNITTIEQVRSQARNRLAPSEPQSNPFALGRWTRNVSYTFCRPAGYTWIQADEIAMEDRRIVSPGAREDWKPREGAFDQT